MLLACTQQSYLPRSILVYSRKLNSFEWNLRRSIDSHQIAMYFINFLIFCGEGEGAEGFICLQSLALVNPCSYLVQKFRSAQIGGWLRRKYLGLVVVFPYILIIVFLLHFKINSYSLWMLYFFLRLILALQCCRKLICLHFFSNNENRRGFFVCSRVCDLNRCLSCSS